MSEKSPVERMVRGGVAPLVAALDALGVSPNALTVAGLLLNFGAAYVVATGRLTTGAIAFLVASGFDVLDGSLARRRGESSRLGAFLDSTFDRLSETALFVALILVHARTPFGPDWMPAVILVALAGSLTTSYARARSESLGQECKVGWVERPERVVILVLGLLLGREILGFTIFALAGLSWFTVIQRIVHVARNIESDD
ncbi:CDP-alcohol phosphatidyltransferase family protein [bacterium]|nr:MAG: CDP-alcohol phosphatidyltransferase family protein [bacterium]RKZ13376.1 MAG: CDP-alcohol phosphatidyltransferase family protein [bacterium]